MGEDHLGLEHKCICQSKNLSNDGMSERANGMLLSKLNSPFNQEELSKTLPPRGHICRILGI